MEEDEDEVFDKFSGYAVDATDDRQADTVRHRSLSNLRCVPWYVFGAMQHLSVNGVKLRGPRRTRRWIRRRPMASAGSLIMLPNHVDVRGGGFAGTLILLPNHPARAVASQLQAAS
jgi:hypothetical protein